MFSYLRPHRRTPSNPTSPVPDQTHSWEPPLHHGPEHAHPSPTRLTPTDVNIPQQNPLSASSNGAPSLPHIARVSSPGYVSDYGAPAEHRNDEGANLHAPEETTSQNWKQSTSRGNIRKSAGYTPDSQQWTQRVSSQRPDAAAVTHTIRNLGAGNTNYPGNTTRQQGIRQNSGSESLPFVTAADLQNTNTSTGRRPTGARMPTPPPVSVPTVSSNFESHKSGKNRLNLLNPMSLLARRRTSQAVPYLVPVPIPQNTLQQGRQEPNYDPRIRGTRVHDFSAPRPRRNVSSNDVRNLESPDYINSQYQRSPNFQNGEMESRIREEDSQRWSGGNHTPVFTEDFDDEQYPAAGPHVRKANDFSDLPVPRPPYAKGAQQPRPHTAQPANTGSLSGEFGQLAISRSPRSSLYPNPDPPILGPPVPPKVDADMVVHKSPVPREDKRISVSSIDSAPRSSTSTKRSIDGRPRKSSTFSAKEAALMGLPKHMKSTSSRFSFDMIGAASQEKLLEDRHRQKALEKSNSPDRHDQDEEEEEEDDYDYDNMMDDDGLEDEIPMINDDLYDDDGGEELIPSINVNLKEMPGIGGQDHGKQDLQEAILKSGDSTHGMHGFTFYPNSMSTSTTTSPNKLYSPVMIGTPRDANGEVIGFALSKESPRVVMEGTPHSIAPPEFQEDLDEAASRSRMSNASQGLGLQGVDVDQDDLYEIHSIPQHEQKAQQSANNDNIVDDDDLYFDDGMIDQLDDGEYGHDFDESVFDNDDTDEYGRPLRPLSSLPTLYSPPYVNDSVPKSESRLESERSSRMSQELLDMEKSESPTLQNIDLTTASLDKTRPQVDQYGIALPQFPASLTSDTLSAYQSALAAAAYNAAANGRFRRDSSPQVQFADHNNNEQLGKTNDISRVDSDMPLPVFPTDEDDFDYDDALEDDDVIAEANREALANDREGFYGQEFGFYSAPATNGEVQYGGYFGPRGSDGVLRSQSGRVVSREPNLTPITERSEYSNRNSFMSQPLSAVSGMGQHNLGGLNSPGLAQLAGMMGDFDEDNISLSALMKLRRGAWGGSQASLMSSNGNGSPLSVGDDNSPVSQLSPWTQPGGSNFSHARKNSTFSLASDVPSHVSEEDGSEIEHSAPSSPTVTMHSMAKPQGHQSPTRNTFGGGDPVKMESWRLETGRMDNSPTIPTPPAGMVASLQNRPISPTMKRHRHTGSADSISYMKEDDPVTGERWVLERRRTGESGEVEILGREVVKGGRI